MGIGGKWGDAGYPLPPPQPKYTARPPALTRLPADTNLRYKSCPDRPEKWNSMGGVGRCTLVMSARASCGSGRYPGMGFMTWTCQ